MTNYDDFRKSIEELQELHRRKIEILSQLALSVWISEQSGIETSKIKSYQRIEKPVPGRYGRTVYKSVLIVKTVDGKVVELENPPEDIKA